MGKMDVLVARANATIPPAAPWGDEQERPPTSHAQEPEAATLDDVMEAANQAEGATDTRGPLDAETPAPPVLKVVEPVPTAPAFLGDEMDVPQREYLRLEGRPGAETAVVADLARLADDDVFQFALEPCQKLHDYIDECPKP